jgi:hypothetical protein
MISVKEGFDLGQEENYITGGQETIRFIIQGGVKIKEIHFQLREGTSKPVIFRMRSGTLRRAFRRCLLQVAKGDIIYSGNWKFPALF